MTSHAAVPLLVALAIAATACAGDEAGDTETGATVAVTQAQADRAMGGLCDIAAGGLTEMADVHEAFHGRAHETLHAVADEAQEVDPVVTGALLEAKSVVETDLEVATPPPDLPAHAGRLVVAFGNALEVIGLQPAPCAVPG